MKAKKSGGPGSTLLARFTAAVFGNRRPIPQDKFIEVNRPRLHYRELGDANKAVALFMHGLYGNAYAFDHVAPDLVDTHRVLALDGRGYGDSEWARGGDYAFREIVSDVFTLIGLLDLKKVTLIGSSMGGIVAMVIAGMRSDITERLVLNDIGPEVNPNRQTRTQESPGLFDQDFASVDAALQCYRRTYPPARNLQECDRNRAGPQLHPSPRQRAAAMENRTAASSDRSSIG
jgi:pimeloyl-ACP methyl ester carboxylesterase